MANKSRLCQKLLALFRRDTLVENLEKIQDFIIVSLCIGLFSVMTIRLGEMFVALLKPSDFQVITADILFILILVELFRLLIIYLQEQRISIGAAVEVSLVSVLREIIVTGVLEIPLNKLLGVCVFLTVLGGLLYLRAWIPAQFNQAETETIGDLINLCNRQELEKNQNSISN